MNTTRPLWALSGLLVASSPNQGDPASDRPETPLITQSLFLAAGGVRFEPFLAAEGAEECRIGDFTPFSALVAPIHNAAHLPVMTLRSISHRCVPIRVRVSGKLRCNSGAGVMRVG
jgi:hypothetical protein